jgi:hypothetical protein
MEEVLEFSFIYSKDAVKVKSFLGSVPRGIECINYMDIYNKLSKNDYLQFEPSDAVVSTYLMKQLQTALGRTTTQNLYYVLGNFDKLTVKGIKDYVGSLTSREIYYKIYHTPEVNLNESMFLFNEAVEFEIDL